MIAWVLIVFHLMPYGYGGRRLARIDFTVSLNNFESVSVLLNVLINLETKLSHLKFKRHLCPLNDYSLFAGATSTFRKSEIAKRGQKI